MDVENERCDTSETMAMTTECITQFLENEVGCSMGLEGGDYTMKRYIKWLLHINDNCN